MAEVTTSTQPLPFEQPVTTLYGVGAERAALLGRLGIRTVRDVLFHVPHRYEDRRQVRPIGDLQVQEPAISHGTVVAMGTKWFRGHTKSIFEIILDDGTGRLHCRWWNLPYMERYFAKGDEVLVFGKLKSLKPSVIDHPETEVIDSGEERSIHMSRITPIYPLTEGLPQRWLRSLIWRTLLAFRGQIREPWAAELSPPESSPSIVLPSRADAIRMIHFPEKLDEPELARKRLALDEFVELQLHIQRRRRNFESKAKALACGGDNRFIKPFLGRLEFKLTTSQTRVLRDLRQDMSGVYPMRRLLQGDVGSGKTVVAACCALMALESAYNVALMAPTEILAEQHFRSFSHWFKPLGIEVFLRTGTRKPLETGEGSKSEFGAGRRMLTVGTHALIESGFRPENLGLVIIDEQHRFGVTQREELLRKGRYPHLLVMTATPIPRTLGLTLYGELDVSTIDELPPRRGAIRTFVRGTDKLPKVWDFIRGQLAVGRQAYVVYPRVEETDEGGIKAVTKEFHRLQENARPFQVGMLHGRLRSSEKEEVMGAFRANQLQVLLATSLIEVGVDVPNATVMLVENSEQFGLAQLHQLRGRIGRGSHESYCILVAEGKSLEARRRLRVLEQNTDGFRIAEEDLKLRGPGELLGQQQSGMPRFRFGDLAKDLELIQRSRDIAARLVKAGGGAELLKPGGLAW